MKAALVAAGGWNESLTAAEDHDLWLRLARIGPVVITPEIVFHLRTHAAQTQFNGIRHLEQQLRTEFVRRLPPAEQALGEHFHQAQRSATVGSFAFSRGRYRKACAFCLGSILKAPRLLRSPISALPILSLLVRSAAGMVCGAWGMACLRRMKVRLKSDQGLGNDSRQVMSPRLFK